MLLLFGARLFYSFCATIYSILGIMLFSSMARYFSNFLNFSFEFKSLLVYSIIRFILAIIQIPAHASILFSMRYLNEAGNYAITQMGNGNYDLGVEEYYNYIGKCNIAISIFILIGLVVLVINWNKPLMNNLYITAEVLSIFVLVLVLSMRIAGICTGKTREMFYLAGM